MEYLEKLKVYGDQVKNVVVKSMVDTACGGQKMLKDVLPGNLVTREYEVERIIYLYFENWVCFLVGSTIGFSRTWSSLENLWCDQTFN
jgi:hypothetical protein